MQIIESEKIIIILTKTWKKIELGTSKLNIYFFILSFEWKNRFLNTDMNYFDVSTWTLEKRKSSKMQINQRLQRSARRPQKMQLYMENFNDEPIKKYLK